MRMQSVIAHDGGLRWRTDVASACAKLLRVRLYLALIAAALIATSSAGAGLIAEAAQRTVKVFGAGGIGRIEPYASGVMVSPDGHILTMLSPILYTDMLRVVLPDGRRLDAELVAADTERSLAVLKVDVANHPYFELTDASPQPGDVVFGLSNQFKIAQGAEWASVQRGVVSAIADLKARQGVLDYVFPGEVYVLDANTNNPGAQGGAVVDLSGRLIGVIGKEVRNTESNTWVNYAVPTTRIRDFVQAAVEGRAIAEAQLPLAKSKERIVDVDLRGIQLIPDVLDRTPAFVDGVEAGSPARQGDLKPDDLILFVGNVLVQTIAEFREEVAKVPALQPLKLVVLRGEDLTPVELLPAASNGANGKPIQETKTP